MKANIYGIDIEYSTQEELSEKIKELRAQRVPKHLQQREAIKTAAAQKLEVFELTEEAPKVEVAEEVVVEEVQKVEEVVEEKLTLKTEDVKQEVNQKKRK